MTVAILGTFDVANFGDALFPLLAQRRLASLGHDVIAVSPRGGRPYGDALESVGLDEFLASGKRVTAVLLGGGNILHASPLTAVYAGGGAPGAAAYPALWLAAEYLARRDDAPLIWNAPGIPVPLPPIAGTHLRRVAEASSLLSVRDTGSHAHLMALGLEPHGGSAGVPLEVNPDSAFELSRLYGARTLERRFTELCRARGRSPDERWLVLHASPRRVEDNPAALAAHFDRLSALLHCSPLLLDLGPCHRDGELLRATAGRMNSPPMLVETPDTLESVSACLSQATSYAGASMHGAIASVSFGVPWLLVPPGEDHKHHDLAQQLNSIERHRPSWESTVSWVEQHGLSAPSQAAQRRRLQLQAVDAHWNKILQLLNPASAAPGSEGVAAAGSLHAAAGRSALPPTTPRHWLHELLPADLLLEQLECAVHAGLPNPRRTQRQLQPPTPAPARSVAQAHARKAAPT